GGRPRPLVALRGLARLPAWSPDGRLLAFVGTDVPGAPDHAEHELFTWDGERARSLTGALDLPVTLGWASDLHDWIYAEMPLRRRTPPAVREVDADGVPAFLFEPPGVRGRTALVLAPHGGPYGAHAPTPELETWMLTSLGYRVLAPNIRGSCGYGAAWVEAIR